MSLINQIELAIAAVVYLTATVYYGVFVRWWASRTGRALFTILTTLTLTIVLVTLSSIFGAFPGRELARNLVYTLVLLNSFLILFSIIEGQAYGRRKIRDRIRDAAEGD